MGRLDNRVALVTGSGFGIGRAIAQELAREGASVFVTDWKEAGAAETAALIEAEVGMGKVAFLAADLSQRESADTLVAACIERFGGLQILVNNAANQTVFPLEEVTDEHWDLMFSVNLDSMMRLCRAASPHLSAGASIINLSSLVGICPIPGRLAYNTTKTAIAGLTRALAVELGVRGIRVNGICPGHIMSVGKEEWQRRYSERDQKIFTTHYALLRVGEPREIGTVAAFLASDDASFITGQNINVDGGMSILSPETASFRAAALED